MQIYLLDLFTSFFNHRGCALGRARLFSAARSRAAFRESLLLRRLRRMICGTPTVCAGASAERGRTVKYCLRVFTYARAFGSVRACPAVGAPGIRRRPQDDTEKGFTILEVLLAGALLFLSLVGFLSVMMVQASGLEMERRMRRAHDAADSALEKMSALSRPLEIEGGSFTLTNDQQIELTECTREWCDQLLTDTNGVRSGDSDSLAGGTAWDANIPFDAQREFVRRWRFERVPARPDVREITLVVLASEESTKPLVIARTRIALRTP